MRRSGEKRKSLEGVEAAIGAVEGTGLEKAELVVSQKKLRGQYDLLQHFNVALMLA